MTVIGTRFVGLLASTGLAAGLVVGVPVGTQAAGVAIKPELVTKIDVGLYPQSIVAAPDGKRVYVAVNDWDRTGTCQAGDSVKVIETSTHSVTGEICLTGRFSGVGELAISPDGAFIYAATSPSYAPLPAGVTPEPELVKIRTSDSKIVGAVDLPLGNDPTRPRWLGDVALGANGKVAYVVRGAGIDIVNTDTDQLAGRIDLPTTTYDGTGLRMAPDGKRLYVTYVTGPNQGFAAPDWRGVAVIDTATQTIARTTDLYQSVLAIAPDSRTLYVSDSSGKASEVKAATDEIVETFDPVPGSQDPWSWSLSPTGGFAYLTASEDREGRLKVLDLATREVTGERVVGREAGKAVFTPDGATAYVPIPISKTIAVFQTQYATPKPQSLPASVQLPKQIEAKGKTVLAGPKPRTKAGQPITTKVRCSPRVISGNPTCTVRTSKSGKVTLRTYGRATIRVIVTQSAPGTGTYKPFTRKKTYTVKR